MLTVLLVLAAISVRPGQRFRELTAPELTTPEVTISIAPSSMDDYQLLRRRTPYTYTCQAWVFEADTQNLYVHAEIVIAPGESRSVTRKAGEYTLDFSVTLKNQRADSVVTVKRGEKVLTRQRSTMYVQMPEGVVLLH